MRLEVLQVAAGLWKQTGGPAEVVPRLCGALARAGCRVTLATLDGPMAEAMGQCEAAGVTVRRFPVDLPAVGYSRAMAQALPALAAQAQIVHSQGLWQSPGWLAGAAARRAQLPLVITPHGCLEPWSLQRSKVKKRVVGHLVEDRLLEQAACLQATAGAEAQAFRQYGLANPVTVIPVGFDETAFRQRPDPEDFYRWFPHCRGKRVLLFLSRIHPKKGVLELVQAWQRLAAAFPDWLLVIAGPDEGNHLATVEQAINAAGLQERIFVAGPLFGHERLAALAVAECFILPTYSENFGIVVAEALAMGTPVITTHGAPWEGVYDHHCGWWVPMGLEGITSALQEALACPPAQLRTMGGRGRSWVTSTFTWDTIARDMLATYQWVLGMGPRPVCVQVLATGVMTSLN